MHSEINRQCQLVQYGDDICVYMRHRNVHTLKENMVEAMKFIINWLDRNSAVIFSRCYKIACTSINIDNDQHIKIKDDIKDLGMILDRKLMK